VSWLIPPLADVVAGDGGNGQRAVDRAHVDDAPAAGLDHLARHGLAHEERALDVDADHRIEIGLGHVQKIRRLEDAGVVHQHIDAAVRGQGARDQRVHVGLVADVAMHVDPAEFARQGLARRVGQIGQHHAGAFAREAAGAGLADALGRRR
jgi:hypothetical protein